MRPSPRNVWDSSRDVYRILLALLKGGTERLGASWISRWHIAEIAAGGALSASPSFLSSEICLLALHRSLSDTYA